MHCAGFLTADQVYAVSSDEQLSVYTLSKPGDAEDAVLPISAFGDVREQLSSSYVVGVFPAAASPGWIAAGDTRYCPITRIIGVCTDWSAVPPS